MTDGVLSPFGARSEQPPSLVGVVGGGTMGAGIAHAFLSAGYRVRVVEVDKHRASAGRERIRTALEKSATLGNLMEEPDVALRRLEVSDSLIALAGVALVIEAVPEDAALKTSVLAAVESAVSESTVIATNTSSIAIGELARTLHRPDRFLGLHFFNPVPASLLVEIVKGADTDPSVTSAAHRWVEVISKEAIVVNDSPGFASSRLGVLLCLEAVRIVEEGVASATDVDNVMRLGYRHPIGPLRLSDLVGLDVRLQIADYLHQELGDRFAAPALLREKVHAGHLGRKTGRGFFDYP